ncbi:farnesyltranstransferase KNAG_0A02000 [Huiozyma naganishii CBS 8797]|uniref:Geranylgeranyl pyrophosphate synthase n=1 Tax=Huiozyma naganishii (strain ATCC MYA-139 / BCRC 22969 / CBS 8797 / KCTC 17520 / NBRC 10181 / NCYC 3082 / Yp74L-3) TaxID=1071383 RepID=J7S1Y4_HUIN7|nr:hypothetical protein KNAG_0A02000 [Kazachstania naganishii CBS 8797]CCK67889.1 hypothetical protein KNAG_0A02000 [Kazachstania naganishii CBS 8797]
MDRWKVKEIVNQAPRWDSSSEALLLKPYLHITQQQGKQFRTKLIHTFNQFYQVPAEILDTLTQIIDILHNSSLLIDDIEDSSALRRGITTSHLIYGVPMTINSANYMYFVAMQLINNFIRGDSTEDLRLHKELTGIFNEELCNLHRGQGLDIYWRDNAVIPTEEMYFDMVMNKTGGLFRLTIRLMETLSNFYNPTAASTHRKSLEPLCNLLGILYQVRDDYLNLTDETMTSNKGFADDITEGKLSFPIIHGLNYEKKVLKQRTILDLVMSKTNDVALKRQVIDFLKENGSMDYTRETIKTLADLIKQGDYLPDPSNNPDTRMQLQYILNHLSDI